ncbi:YpmA family protein [Halalkalibacter urbisdiaboli]|uniref:YpmA family protein n=1 Tax=Halalkalibacter urbisdiaboli TaxID=1960589 RepID=UPI000B43E0E3|nr:YpmA family protein [Halalkalibacter urbisdiaboli]
MEQQKVEVLSTVRVNKASDLYKIVDSLNRTLKEQDLMFGLALDQKNEEKMVFTIYRT